MQLRADKAPGNAPFAVQHKGRGRGAHIAPLARKRAIAVMRYRVRRPDYIYMGKDLNFYSFWPIISEVAEKGFCVFADEPEYDAGFVIPTAFC